MEADTDRDGKISFEEFTKMVENTDVSMSMTLGTTSPYLIRKCSHTPRPLSEVSTGNNVGGRCLRPYRSNLVDPPE